MLLPKRVKYRRQHRLRGSSFSGNSKGGNELAFGSYGLKAMSAQEVSSRQIEAARRAMTRFVKRGGKIWIRIFPHKPVTQKSAEVPMGSGKGALDRFVAMVRPGTILFEMDGIEESMAKEALERAGHKLPLRVRFVSSNDL